MKAEAQNIQDTTSLVTIFTSKAEAVAAKVIEITSFEEAVNYTTELLNKLSEHSSPKTVAAPGLNSEDFVLLQQSCDANNISCIGCDLRNRLAGIDIGLTYGSFGIADTGTIVLNCPEEELRLATMVSDHHVCILPKSKLVHDSTDLEAQLKKFMQNTPDYTAFITGPSRTADIERILTIGVHGPKELHVLLLEDQ